MVELLIVVFIIITLLMIIKLSLTSYRERFIKTQYIYTPSSEQLSHPIKVNAYQVGYAQFKGDNEEQTLSTSLLNKGNLTLVVIADGLVDHQKGRLASVVATEIMKANFLSSMIQEQGIPYFFTRSLEQIDARVQTDNLVKNIGLIIGLLIDNVLYHVNIGHNQLLLYRQNELITLTKSGDNLRKPTRLTIHSKDKLLFASKGIHDTLTEMEILWQVQRNYHPQRKCQGLLKEMRKKQQLEQNNCALVLMEKNN